MASNIIHHNIALEIRDDRTIDSIQEEFAKEFPYLKLEFFTRTNSIANPNFKKIVKHNSKFIRECRTIHNNGTINILPNMSIATLEQNFKTEFGLSVQVLRKSGKVWLETTLTNNWSLAEQNRQGEELSMGHSG